MENRLAEAFPAGEFLADELEARSWSQADFAEILGRPTQFVSEIIAGKKEITRESASQIGAALGQSAELWLNLQNSYLLWKQGQDVVSRQQLDDVRRRARMNAIAPVAILKKRGFLKGQSLDELEEELRILLKVSDLDEEAAFLTAARRSNENEPLTPTQNGWLACARSIAQTSRAEDFDKKGLKKLAPTISQAASKPNGLANCRDCSSGWEFASSTWRRSLRASSAALHFC